MHLLGYLTKLEVARCKNQLRTLGSQPLIFRLCWPELRHLELQEVIESKELGEIRLLTASHNQLLTHVERLQDPDLGGGAMLDLGIYPLSFAYRVLGSPTAVHANGQSVRRLRLSR